MQNHIYTACTNALLLATLLTPMLTYGWSGDLNDGSQITVDATTGKVLRHSGDVSGQLWDGIHQLNDGAVVIVRDGIAISRSGGTETPAEPPRALKENEESLAPRAISPCMELMIKVCGFNGACKQSSACSPARQLVELEKIETLRGNRENSAEQCTEALANKGFFSPCKQTIHSGKQTPCQRLVKRVCGTENECNDGKGCAPAQQLLKMELEELRFIQDINRLTATSKQCEEAYRRRNVFPSCREDDDGDDEEEYCD